MRAIPHMVITNDEVLDTAFAWLCKRRRAYPEDANVWSLRQAWAQEKNKIKAALASGRYRFGLFTKITLVGGEEVDLWSARGALVLKALTGYFVDRSVSILSAECEVFGVGAPPKPRHWAPAWQARIRNRFGAPSASDRLELIRNFGRDRPKQLRFRRTHEHVRKAPFGPVQYAHVRSLTQGLRPRHVRREGGDA